MSKDETWKIIEGILAQEKESSKIHIDIVRKYLGEAVKEAHQNIIDILKDEKMQEKLLLEFKEKEWTKKYSKSDFPEKSFFNWYLKFVLSKLKGGEKHGKT